LLERDPRMVRSPVTARDVFGRNEFVTDNGDLRTLPLHLPDSDPLWGGLDGFYAARLTRKSA
jgi:16S rRNA (cytosine967-C5)-methyltransferase